MWKENGPRNYDWTYKKRIGESTDEDVFVVSVRHGQVDKVVMNPDTPQQQILPPRLREFHAMPALFNDIEEFWERDSKPGARACSPCWILTRTMATSSAMSGGSWAPASGWKSS